MEIRSNKEIKKEIKRLRKLIDTTDDTILGRVAYTVESVLLWVITPDAEWDNPKEEVIVETKILKEEYKCGEM